MPDFINVLLNEPIFVKILIGLFGVTIILSLSRLLLKKLTDSIENPDHRYRMRKLIVFLGYLLAVLFLAGEFSNQLHSITIALGVASAGIAFALQEVIVSAAGWLAISFGRFYKIGDRIQLSGTVGDVIDIGIFSTTLMEIGAWIKGDQYSGRVVRLANSFVFSEPVYNFSADFPYLWDELVLPVMYGSSIQATRTILQTAADHVVGKYIEPAKTYWAIIYNKYRLEHESVNPLVTMTANDNWMEFTLRYVVDYKARRGTKDQLFESILNQIEESSGQVKVASTTLQLVDLPTVKIDHP
ncbi:MAG: mechanosensitive ion channel family protein, partial [Anaerolineales bacterium]|nr:mechanosensitive ion channel family protein [Anaerolineales bacterium]